MKKQKFLSREQIADRVVELGAAITADYQDDELVLLGILNGAFIFTADLCRTIDLPLVLDFVRVASYGEETFSSGTISFTKDVELEIRDKDVLLVEDIIDTGRTIMYLKDLFQKRGCRSVKICTLVNKTERRELQIKPDYVGFTVAEGFLLGYGLDSAQHYRQLPAIYKLIEE